MQNIEKYFPVVYRILKDAEAKMDDGNPDKEIVSEYINHLVSLKESNADYRCCFNCSDMKPEDKLFRHAGGPRREYLCLTCIISLVGIDGYVAYDTVRNLWILPGDYWLPVEGYPFPSSKNCQRVEINEDGIKFFHYASETAGLGGTTKNKVRIEKISDIAAKMEPVRKSSQSH